MVIDSDLDLLWLHPLGDVGCMPHLLCIWKLLNELFTRECLENYYNWV